MPLVPQTALPFFIYLRARAEAGTQGRLTILRALPDQPHEVLTSAAVPPSGRWEWVCTGPYSYRLGTAFCVSAGAGKAEETVALDALVIATEGGLTDKDLSAGVTTR